MSEERILVRASEIAVAGPGTGLAAIGLGSCVVAALYDAEAGVAGLAHPLLPESPGADAQRRDHRAYRYVGAAIHALVRDMEAAGAQPGRMTARLAGGARMFARLFGEDGNGLGDRNLAAAHATLDALGIRVVGEAVGGEGGRSIHLDTTDGTVRVSSIGKQDVFL
jgi:chemotaxis protein CheD